MVAAVRISALFWMKLERLSTPETVARRGADFVVDVLRTRPEAVLLLPAGRTPEPLYAELARRQQAGELHLERARFFQLDELVGVGPADERGFHRFLVDRFLRPAGLRQEQLHALDGAASDPDEEIARHGAALEELGGADLCLLGIGGNGHVAFNEPGSGRSERARRVELAAATRNGLRAAFGGACPTEGITLGVAELFASRRVVLLATGTGKARVVRRLAEGRSHADLPASHFHAHEAFHVLVDEPASAELD